MSKESKGETRMILRICAMLLLAPVFTDAKIDILVTTQDYEVGSKILLLCKVNTEADCIWLKNEEEIDDDWVEVKKLDESLYELTIKSARMDDMGHYTCDCEFDSGPRNSTDLMIYVYERPTFANEAIYYEFPEGEVAVIPCFVTGKPQVDVKWQRIGSNTTADFDDRITVLKNNSLQINGVRREDNGAYSCVARIRGRPISETLIISIVVTVAPKVRIQEHEKSVLEGPENSVSIVCLVTGEPAPNITWSSPVLSNTSRYIFNSDKSELTIPSVDFSDNGEYICTARNKIGAQNVNFKLNVLVHPIVNLTTESMEVKPGNLASVTCHVTGQPTPTITWMKKSTNAKLTSRSGRVKVMGSTLQIEKVESSDGGLYTCMAHNTAGNNSKDFSLETWPGPPAQVTTNAGTTSITFSTVVPVINGGSPITNYILEWRKKGADKWAQILVPFKETVSISSLKPSTSYFVRMAAHNRIGQGEFSSEYSIQTLPEGEGPILLTSEGRMENNSFSISFKQPDHSKTSITHYSVRYRSPSVDNDWKTEKLPSNSTRILLANLSYNTSYLVELVAFKSTGTSRPTFFNFTTPQLATMVKPNKSGMGKAGMVGIVMLIFVVMLVAVDATCCYTNNCGVLMFLAVKLLGRKVPKDKGLEQGNAEISTVILPPSSTPSTEA